MRVLLSVEVVEALVAGGLPANAVVSQWFLTAQRTANSRFSPHLTVTTLEHARAAVMASGALHPHVTALQAIERICLQQGRVFDIGGGVARRFHRLILASAQLNAATGVETLTLLDLAAASEHGCQFAIKVTPELEKLNRHSQGCSLFDPWTGMTY